MRLVDDKFCAHCAELWKKAVNGSYGLTENMKEAWDVYRQGERKALARWRGTEDLPEVYDEVVLVTKDVLKDSDFELEAAWPGLFYHDVVRIVANDMGVLFPDAGRSQNPYVRTKTQQANIALYIKRAMRLYIRVRSSVTATEMRAHMSELAVMAKAIAAASMRVVQARFPHDPTFVGPIVEVDIVLAALMHADDRFSTLLSKTMDDST